MATILKENRDGTIGITQTGKEKRKLKMSRAAYDEIELAVLTYNKQRASGVNEIHVDDNWVQTMVIKYGKREQVKPEAAPKSE